MDLKLRWYEHRRVLALGQHHSRHLQRAWSKYGASEFVFDILELCPRDQLIDREQFWMNRLMPKFNGRPRASNNLGMRQSDETRRKVGEAQLRLWADPDYRESMRAKHRGQKATPAQLVSLSIGWRTAAGRTVSAETRAKISMVQRGRVQSAATRAKRSASAMGRVQSEVTRVKLSKAHLELWTDPEHRAKMRAANFGRSISPEVRARMRMSTAARVVTAQTRDKIRASVRELWKDPDYRANMVAKHRKAPT